MNKFEKEYQEKVAAMRAEHDRAVAEMYVQHEERVAAMREAHAKRVAEMKAEHDKRVVEMYVQPTAPTITSTSSASQQHQTIMQMHDQFMSESVQQFHQQQLRDMEHQMLVNSMFMNMMF